MKHIAVLTSGGDAPGMNAAIRAVVRTAIFYDMKVSGVYRGYQGMIDDEIEELGARGVAYILERGGTVLRTARCMPFMEPEGRAIAAANLKKRGIEGVVVIGGDGSFRGAHHLCSEHDIPVVGVPGTIDNDIAGTDVTIGFNTALNIALDAIDRLRDTAASHDRLFVVEVMGRASGHIALNVGVASGADAILIPEVPVNTQETIEAMKAARARGKGSSIVIVAEGALPDGAFGLSRILEEQGLEAKTTILGHIQRGGSPVTRDRVLASRLGYHAVRALRDGKRDVMIGVDKRGTCAVPLKDTWESTKAVDLELYQLAKVLAV